MMEDNFGMTEMNGKGQISQDAQYANYCRDHGAWEGNDLVSYYRDMAVVALLFLYISYIICLILRRHLVIEFHRMH